MLILFDHGTPAPLRSFLSGHTIRRTQDVGWDRFSNGELLDAAEKAGIEILVTTDKNIRSQQNLAAQKIAIVVLGNPQWPILRRYVDRVAAAVNPAKPGSYTEVDIPDR